MAWGVLMTNVQNRGTEECNLCNEDFLSCSEECLIHRRSDDGCIDSCYDDVENCLVINCQSTVDIPRYLQNQ